tara:strand:- start:2245 stop:2613 length:369 start_codon:yes stop_codon:yes gene_type:complete
MEFFSLVGLAFLMVILFVVISVNEVKEFRDKKEFLLIKDLALKLQKEVSIAASVEDGYERSFDLEEELENIVDYFMVIGNETLTINSSRAVFSVAIPETLGKNFTKGTNKIEKENGEIYINR